MERPLIEACVDSYASCRAAANAGADRIELCGQLLIGGVTPSPALFQQIKRDFSIKINVLIRPRFGDFLYSEQEISQMCEEIKLFRELGADGIVIGALNAEGDLDDTAMQRFIDCAEGIHVTLHRAFDMTRRPLSTLETAISLGCNTILTSGQEKSAEEGVFMLKTLAFLSRGRIEIMAGGGINRGNIREIHEKTMVRAFHASAKKTVESGMKFRRENLSMGLPLMSEYQTFVTDEEEFRACAKLVHSL